MLDQQSNQLAYRSDVAKVETKDKMAIKEGEVERKDEEFVNVETSYKKTR